MRQKVLAMRRALAPGEVRERSQAVLENLYQSGLLDGRDTAAIYASADSEVATRPLFDRLIGQGMRVALPRVRGRGPEIDFFQVTDWEAMVNSSFGIPEPAAGGLAVSVAELDFILVPGIAFDARGGRLGYGMGCYDRVLDQARPGTPLVGIGYDFQLVDEVPLEEHDVPLTAIVIERGTLLAANGRSN
ncbi:MAG TPA: 5-formyltetrahydrofolate cyclo-ligase [bacterium]|nr:5-formyltetrahydrofolate cyclo-ligase [bacterium]